MIAGQAGIESVGAGVGVGVAVWDEALAVGVELGLGVSEALGVVVTVGVAVTDEYGVAEGDELRATVTVDPALAFSGGVPSPATTTRTPGIVSRAATAWSRAPGDAAHTVASRPSNCTVAVSARDSRARRASSASVDCRVCADQ